MQVKHVALNALIGIARLCSSHVGPDQLRLNQPTFMQVKHALEKAGIISEVVDEFTPKCFVAPSYGKKRIPVTLGNKLKSEEAHEEPELKIYCPDSKETKGMTIVLTDPDAPTRTDAKWGEFCHWITTIMTPLSDDEVNMNFDGNSIVSYKPPSPPEKTGPHRYVFILLEGDNTNLTAPEDRKRWGAPPEKAGHGVRDWAEKEGLRVVGANFFYVENVK